MIANFGRIKELDLENCLSEQVIDSRDKGGFLSGHIKGSINIPVSELIDFPDITLKPADERIAIFKSHGVDLDKDIVTCCQIGVTACVAYSGLKDIAKGNVRVYDGSWAEFHNLVEVE